jgi:hypothetical protein
MPSHTYSMLGLWRESVASNTKSRAVARELAAKLWPGATSPGEPHFLDFMEYALLQIGHEGPAKQLRDDSNAIKKLGFEAVYAYTGLAAVPARFALERQAWKEAAALEPRGSHSRRPRRSPILPAPWDRPAAAILPLLTARSTN